MRANKINRFATGLALVFALAFGLILVSSSEASGQGRSGKIKGQNSRRHDDSYKHGRQKRNRDADEGRDDDEYYGEDDEDRINGRDRNGNQSVRFAYRRGYQAGRKQARQEMRGRNRNRNNDDRDYDRLPNEDSYGSGNHGGWGDDEAFREAYEEGFERGYDDAINNRRNNRTSNNNSRRQSGVGRILGLPF